MFLLGWSCPFILRRHALPLTWPIVCNIWLKVDLVWSNCRRFTYHKEMNTINMTFTAPSLQVRSNAFHSYEFEYREPVLNRCLRSFSQTGTFSKKSAIHSSYATTDDTIQILRMQKRWFERQCWCICLSLPKLCHISLTLVLNYLANWLLTY